MRNALIRYRIMAYLVGCLLVVLVCVGLPLKYFFNNPFVVTWTAIPHGYLYMVLLITAIDLGRRARWSWRRLILIALLIVLLVSTVLGRTAVGTGGQARPLVLLLAIAAASQVLNASELATVAADNPSKGLSSFLTFFIAFVLVCSVITSERQIDTLLAAMVVGGTIIAGLALAEAVTGYNPFNHLGEWLPGFVEQPREVLELRGGRERVYASAQHPIALGAATTLMIPLALYLASKARALRRWLWLGATLILATSALATVSKTVVVMALTMIVVGVWLRGAAIARFWPVLILLPIVAHVITPGALGGLWKSFFPEEGLVTQLGGRAGEAGSGRLGDFDPAMIRACPSRERIPHCRRWSSTTSI